jgi:hypothetical protein
MADYLSHFGLPRAPFSTAPGPAFACATREHKQALAKIAYYTEEHRGMFLLIGEAGTGKTITSQLSINRWRGEPGRFFAAPVTGPRRPSRAWCWPRSGSRRPGTSCVILDHWMAEAGEGVVSKATTWSQNDTI